ncbi:MAG: hypothetical protein R2681_14365 [Pyrinomonadaceae bacterium]
MKRLSIPEDLIPKLKELQEEHSAFEIYDFLKEKNAIQMFTALGIDMYLTFDGQVLVADYFEDENCEPRNAKSLAEVTMALILGARKRNFPEILTLLPPRPETAANCGFCENSSGWNTLSDIGKFICDKCGGLGWIVEDQLVDF